MTCIAPGCTRPREVGAMFCAVCLLQPPGKRGGWLSAHKRKLAAGGDALDVSNIVRRLWMGSKPPDDRPLAFDTVVLCAEEYQPRMPHVPDVVRVPINDAQLTPAELKRVLEGAQAVAQRLAAGQRVLVTCWAGRNRSGLVAGLALGLVTRSSADRIIATIRARRSPNALSNHHFVAYLRTFIGRGRPRR